MAVEMFRMYEQYSKDIKFSELKNPEESWELLDIIGEGTYGEVYSAKNKHTGEVTAVKILENIHEIIEEVEVEYKIFMKYGDHPNMPKFHGLYLRQGETGSDDQLWFIMELCSKGSVTELSKSLIAKGKKMDEVMVAYILRETLQVLEFLHKNHIIHRDIKGHNILITDSGSIKLIDFGVSGQLHSTLDRKKTSVGTPYWMAPEVIACERQLDYSYDIRCDIWSLGITAIELLDGEPPLADKHPMRALFRIPRNPSPQPKNPSDWSATCRDFISKCLIKDYEQRPLAWDLLNHPFIKQVSSDTTKIRGAIVQLASQMERVIPEPDVTTKQGRLKSGKVRHSEPVQTVEDLAKLEVLDEEAIVSQLFTRYSQGQIYTYIGDILLAVNPFTPLTIYNDEHSRRYMNQAKGDHPPHIYAIADQAYQMMMHQKKNQCIVISGESGAGKTESANFMVQQLTQLGKAPNRNLEERILQVNPLMEAFGNAKTVINDNSSRFGKYLEMFFTTTGTVIGAKITEYLLEKSRVISQAPGEQNFHIFYYVHDGLPSEDKNHIYHLKDNASYRYISENNSSTPDIATLSANRVRFKAIQHCFDSIGFKPEEVSCIYGILAAILHTGNIEFKDRESEVYAGDAVEVANMELVEIVARLLGLVPKDLVDCLISTGMVARGEIIIRENTMPEATDARDAMAKSLYGRLFSWIVNKINMLLRPDKSLYRDESSRIIGILDIFGFENFKINSFEQLCINIANEQIQYYFNQHIFAWEMQEYINEGVDGSVITFVDNRPLLDMFLMKPMGLLALLDEESHFPKATDLTLVEKFHQNIKNPFYMRPKSTSLNFSIAHYAGIVHYDAVGFLEKNRDRLPVEIVNLLRASESSVVRSLFQTPLTKTGNLANGSRGTSAASSNLASPASGTSNFSIGSVMSVRTQVSSSMGGSRGSSTSSMTRLQQTVATYFRFSLMDLLSKMVAGSPHFVRCIRPNEDKKPDQFDTQKVITQLKYTGVLETTRIRREGYSHRIPFTEFMQRYSFLGQRSPENLIADKSGCQVLLKRLGLTSWALGHTKVFLKYYHIELLARKSEDFLRKVTRIQAVFRMILTRNRYYELRWKREKAVIQMQRYVRGWLVYRKYRHVFRNRHEAAVTIQKVLRGHITRKKVVPIIRHRRKAAVQIQSHVRGYFVRKSVHKQQSKEHSSAIMIQKAFRSHRARAVAKQLMAEKKLAVLDAAVKIQTYYRMWRCQTIFQQLQQYKEQKELQLIYFTQQVEAYGKDTFSSLQTNNFCVNPHYDSKYTSPKKQAPEPPRGEPEPIYAVPDKSRKRRAPVRPTESLKEAKVEFVPHIGEERLEHLKKMAELKTLMPDLEFQYYSRLNNQGATVQEVVIDFEEPQPSTSKVKENKDILDPKAEVYYSEIARKSSFSANSTSSSETLGLGVEASTLPGPAVIDWDEPLLKAKQQALAKISLSDEKMEKLPKSDEKMERLPNGDIMEDLKTDRDEAFFENEMSELVQHLEEEYRQSAIANWNKLRKLFLKRYFTQATSLSQANQNVNSSTTSRNDSGELLTPNGKTESSYKSRQRVPTPPLLQRTVIQIGPLSDHSFSSSQSGSGYSRSSHSQVEQRSSHNHVEPKPSHSQVRPWSSSNQVTHKSPTKVQFSSGEPTVIGVGIQKNNNNILNQNFNHFTSSNDSINVNFRSMLKRTTIDPDHSMKVGTEDNKPVYDFRKLLRRTGRLDFIEQEQ